MVSHCVQARTTASTVAFLRWLVLWPISSVTWMALRCDFSDRTAEPNKVSQSQEKIPGEDTCVVESVGDTIEDRHSAV